MRCFLAPIVPVVATGCLLVAGWSAQSHASESITTTPIASGSDSAEIDRIVGDVCEKDVVLLGEDSHHGSGKTLEIKTEIAKKLIGQCQFSAVFFESQVYDFFGLQQALSAKSATQAQVADAIGGLWSTTAEMEPLIDYLFQEAVDGNIRLAGLDPQTGGATNFYTQKNLPRRLVRSLQGRRKAECETEVHRLTNWEYDDKSPYDDNARDRLRSCIAAIKAGIARDPDKFAAESTVMASNLMHSLDMEYDAGARDAAMYENFVWLRSRLPRNTKILIWCATVHARKTRADKPGAVTRLGTYIHDSLAERAAAIGFSARSGSYGRRTVKLDLAAPSSLEDRAFAHGDGTLRYLDGRQLHAYGDILARAFDYDKPESRDWSNVLDGLIVLRQENPPQYVHSAKPRQ